MIRIILDIDDDSINIRIPRNSENVVKQEKPKKIDFEVIDKIDLSGSQDLEHSIKMPVPEITKKLKSTRRMPMKKSRECPTCGEKFKPQGPRQKYCSEPCGMKPKSQKERDKDKNKRILAKSNRLAEELERDNQLDQMNKAASEVIKAGQSLGKDLGDIIRAQETEKKLDPLDRRNKGETVDSSKIQFVKCGYCGEEFATDQPGDKFCSARCDSLFKKGRKKQ